LRLKILLFLTITVLVLAGCSSSSENIESISLMNQEKQTVSFPQDKPVLFFFITTYT
jgi:uncharacterized protein YcfL